MGEATKAAAKRNVGILVGCQALAMTATTIIAVVTGLVGLSLATDKALATVPLGLQFGSMMLSTIPSAYVMRRFGRRVGFAMGSLAGTAGGLLAAQAIFAGSFWGFAGASMVIGFANGVAQLYRFAAAEAAPEAYRSRAISLVMAGGVVAATLGPELAKASRELFQPILFAGCFVVVAGLHGAGLLAQQFLRMPGLSAAERRDSGRPLRVIARQPEFLVALAGGMIGYAVMSLLMTATPLAMLACGLPFDDSAFVIQWHALGMFAPAFFTGSLIHRFGVLRIMNAGAVLVILCIVINLTGVTLAHFWTALFLLGVGWNFLFVGATTLLTRTHTVAERSKVQSLNDFLVFGLVTVASFGSGALQYAVGWEAVNLMVAPAIALTLGALAWLGWTGRARRAA